MLTSALRRWQVAGIAATVLFAIAGWLLLVSPQRDAASANWAELTDAQAQTAALQSRINVLAKQFEEIDVRRAELAVKRQALPATNDLEALVRALNAAGAATGVTIEAVTTQEPVDISPPTQAPTTAPTSAPEAAATSAPAAPTAGPPPARFQMFVLPVTIRASGSLAAMERFLSIVQNEQPRAILFNSFSLAPGSDGATLGDSVTLTAETSVFVSPIPGSAPAATPTG